MGYMDISILGSDRASDMTLDIIGSIAKHLKKTLREGSNEYNTSGGVNVALFFEEVILPAIHVFEYDERLFEVAKKCQENLQIEIEDSEDSDLWEDEENRMMHYRKYVKLYKVLDEFIAAHNSFLS
mgnify:CR=1 FL=1